MLISFTLDVSPVAKGRPRFCRVGKFVKTYTPGKTLAFESAIAWEAKKYAPKEPILGPIDLSLVFYMPIPKSRMGKKGGLELDAHQIKPDIDNLFKGATDALNGLFWKDDSQICRVVMWKVYSSKPRIEYSISYQQ